MKTNTAAAEVKLIDVIHLYIGQKILSYWGDKPEIQTFVGVVGSLVIIEYNDDVIREMVDLSFKQKKGKEVKLVLRNIADITLKEMNELISINREPNEIISGVHFRLEAVWFNKKTARMRYNVSDAIQLNSPQANELLYLLKKGFDVFGLIESGQAVDIKTLNK